MTDRTSRVFLGIIALSLATIALRGSSPVPAAHAADTMECVIKGPLEIRSIGGEVKVKMEQAYGTPGSSSGYPMHIRTSD